MNRVANALLNVGREIVGLFVDDWAFALLLVAWIAVVAVMRPYILRAPGPLVSPLAPGPLVLPLLLFGGLAALTLVFVARKARALRSPPEPEV